MNIRAISLCLLVFLSASLSWAASDEKELFIVAQRAFEDGFYDVSLRYVDQLGQEFPNSSRHTEIKLLEGQCYFFKKEYLKAFSAFQQLEKGSEYKDVVLFWLGETYLKVGDHAKAREQYRKLIDGYQGSLYAPQAYYSLGWSYFEKGEYDEAKKAFLKLTELFPASNLAEDASFKLGECDYNAGRYEGAVFFFDKYMTAHPHSARLSEALFNIGEADYYLEQYTKAAEFYEKARAVAVDPRTALNAMVGEGWSLLKKNDLDGAVKVFAMARAHARANSFPEDDILLGEASVFTAQEQYVKAAGSYGELIEHFPASSRVAESYLGRANAYYLTTDYGKAIDDYKKLIALFDGNAHYTQTVEKARFGLAWTYLKKGDIDLSIAGFQAVIDATDNKTVKMSALTQIGDACQEAGRLDDAIAAYDKILKEAPDSPYADYVQYRLGIALLKSGKSDPALLAFQALSANYPNSKLVPESHYYVGVVYFRKRDWPSVVDAMGTFLKTAARESEFAPDAMYLKALSLFHMKQYDKASAAFTELQKAYPSQSSIQQNVSLGLAEIRYETGSVKEALVTFGDIVKQYPGSDAALEALLWLGENAMSTAKYDAAAGYYGQALKDFPNSDKRFLAWFERGRAFHAQGMLDKAVEQYRNVEGASVDPGLVAKARLAIADIFTRELDPARAEETYRGIIQSSPEYKRDALIKIAQLARKADRSRDEIQAYEDALASFRGVSAVTEAQLQFLIGDAYEAMNDPDKACESYVKVTYLHPKETTWVVKANLRIGRIYENREEWDKAITAYKKVAGMTVEEAKFAGERIAWIGEHRNKK